MPRPSTRAKERINAVLARVSGYHLTKGEPGSAEERLQAANRQLADVRGKLKHTRGNLAQSRHDLREARGRLKNTRGELKKARSRIKQFQQDKRRRQREYPIDFDEPMCELINAVRDRTMTDRFKLFALISAVRYIVEHNVPGDIVECGVWRGGSMQAVARELVRLGVTDRDLHLFDTFEGMSAPTDADVRWDGKTASELLEANDMSRNIWAAASLEDVQAGFEPIPYPSEKIHYIKGKVEDTVPAQVPETISILRLDTDWYESSLHELDHMYDRLVPGGVLLLDDYGYWEGQRRATDEWLARTKEPLLLLRMGQGRAAVKVR